MRKSLRAFKEITGPDLQELLGHVTLDSEVVGVIGRGYPQSFYRIHVYIEGLWYGFENGALRETVTGHRAHPLTGRHGHLKLPVEERGTSMVTGQLRHLLVGYKTMPGRQALADVLSYGRKLMAKAVAERDAAHGKASVVSA